MNFKILKLANAIRHEARVDGAIEPVKLPNIADTQALIQWTIENTIPYDKTKAVMAEAAKTYTPLMSPLRGDIVQGE